MIILLIDCIEGCSRCSDGVSCDCNLILLFKEMNNNIRNFNFFKDELTGVEVRRENLKAIFGFDGDCKEEIKKNEGDL